MPNPVKERKKIRLSDLRLITAAVIVRNHAYVTGGKLDIDSATYIAELADQYCLFIVLNWLGTKYDFAVCNSTIDPSSLIAELPLISSPSLANEYPLHSPPDRQVEKDLVAELFPLLEILPSSKLQLAGDLYQTILSEEMAIDERGKPYISKRAKGKIQGEYYTPNWVVDHALDLALDGTLSDLISKTEENAKCNPEKNLPESGFFKVIDLSCGCGNFLLGIVEWLTKRGNGAIDICSIISTGLYGLDIDSRALSICRILLSICYVQEMRSQRNLAALPESNLANLHGQLKRHIKVSNGLMLDSEAKSAFSKEGFDLVCGNPPYISFGARNQNRINKDWQRYLKARFRHSAEYKLRTSAIFQELSLEFCRPGGRVLLLVPDAFLNGAYYAKLRKYILSEAEIHSLSELPADTIDGATVGAWCLAHYRKKAPGNNWNQSVALRHFKSSSLPASLMTVGLADIISKDKSRLQLHKCQADLRLFREITKFNILGSVLKGHTGIRARHGQSSIIGAEIMEGYAPGLISGGQLRQYHVRWQGHYLNLDPQKLYAGGFAKEIIESPKILVRQTADSIVAAVDESGLYHLNNIHSFSTRRLIPSQAEVDAEFLYFLCGLLNSSLYLRIYRAKSREGGRALAQIDIEMLEAMPFPVFSKGVQVQIAELAKLLSDNTKREDKAERDRLIYLQEIDRLVLESFSLDEPPAGR